MFVRSVVFELEQVYVRPAGSYVMDRLELRRVTSHPVSKVNASDIVILVGNFNVPTGLRAAEAALSNQQVNDLITFVAQSFIAICFIFFLGVGS